MNVQIINPFIQGTQSILESVCGEKTKLGKLYLKVSPFTGERVSIIIGIVGDVKGQVIFSLNISSACSIASKMMMGMPVTELDELAKSAISELTNMILGHVATIFSEMGMVTDITPPSLLMGENIQISTTKMNTVCIPLEMSDGTNFEIDVALQQK